MRVTTIQSIARKEFYHLIRDFRSLYLAFAIPLLLILLFGYALSLDVDNVKTVVVDHDRTALSRDFISRLDASAYFNVMRYLPGNREVTEYMDNGWATMAIVIPPDWTEKIESDREAPLQIILDGSDPNFASMSAGYITRYVSEYNNRLLEDFLNRRGMEKIMQPVSGAIRVWFNEDLESRNFIVPGIIAIIIMIVGAMLTSLIIAREYENGTMETIFSLPIGAVEFFIGKAIPYFFIGLTDVLIAVLMGQLLFGVVMKSNFWLLILAASLYLFVALSLGLLISILTKSQLVANQVAVLITYLPSLLLSDFVFPIVNMPKVLQVVTYIVPARYFIDILNGLYLRNLGLHMLWPSYAVLIVMFLFLSILTLVKLKREGL
ncbi:MAG: ABC transporter permease [Deltaproteobacteria bacterium]|nr:ABC transporter permease [Deltaproteobacteria bacterium]MBN2687244.1 ABC transporter permease [Deltaproteobacteria bacterium]